MWLVAYFTQSFKVKRVLPKMAQTALCYIYKPYPTKVIRCHGDLKSFTRRFPSLILKVQGHASIVYQEIQSCLLLGEFLDEFTNAIH